MHRAGPGERGGAAYGRRAVATPKGASMQISVTGKGLKILFGAPGRHLDLRHYEDTPRACELNMDEHFFVSDYNPGNPSGHQWQCVPIPAPFLGPRRALPYIGAAFGAGCHAAGNGALRRSESCWLKGNITSCMRRSIAGASRAACWPSAGRALYARAVYSARWGVAGASRPRKAKASRTTAARVMSSKRSSDQ